MSTTLILIRHGQTKLNYQKRYCGSSDICLNKKGLTQAKKLSQRLHKLCTTSSLLLNKEKIHRVYSSDMRRAVQFAKIVLKNMTIKKLPELREMNFGIFEGLTYREIMNRYPDIYRNWIDNPLSVAIPGAETLYKVVKRVRKAMKEILSSNKDKTIAVFTHAGPLSIILCDIFKLKLKKIWQMKQDTASISIIELNRSKAKIHLLNNKFYE